MADNDVKERELQNREGALASREAALEKARRALAQEKVSFQKEQTSALQALAAQKKMDEEEIAALKRKLDEEAAATATATAAAASSAAAPQPSPSSAGHAAEFKRQLDALFSALVRSMTEVSDLFAQMDLEKSALLADSVAAAERSVAALLALEADQRSRIALERAQAAATVSAEEAAAMATLRVEAAAAKQQQRELATLVAELNEKLAHAEKERQEREETFKQQLEQAQQQQQQQRQNSACDVHHNQVHFDVAATKLHEEGYQHPRLRSPEPSADHDPASPAIYHLALLQHDGEEQQEEEIASPSAASPPRRVTTTAAAAANKNSGSEQVSSQKRSSSGGGAVTHVHFSALSPEATAAAAALGSTESSSDVVVVNEGEEGGAAAAAAAASSPPYVPGRRAGERPPTPPNAHHTVLMNNNNHESGAASQSSAATSHTSKKTHFSAMAPKVLETSGVLPASMASVPGGDDDVSPVFKHREGERPPTPPPHHGSPAVAATHKVHFSAVKGGSVEQIVPAPSVLYEEEEELQLNSNNNNMAASSPSNAVMSDDELGAGLPRLRPRPPTPPNAHHHPGHSNPTSPHQQQQQNQQQHHANVHVQFDDAHMQIIPAREEESVVGEVAASASSSSHKSPSRHQLPTSSSATTTTIGKSDSSVIVSPLSSSYPVSAVLLDSSSFSDGSASFNPSGSETESEYRLRKSFEVVENDALRHVQISLMDLLVEQHISVAATFSKAVQSAIRFEYATHAVAHASLAQARLDAATYRCELNKAQARIESLRHEVSTVHTKDHTVSQSITSLRLLLSNKAKKIDDLKSALDKEKDVASETRHRYDSSNKTLVSLSDRVLKLEDHCRRWKRVALALKVKQDEGAPDDSIVAELRRLVGKTASSASPIGVPGESGGLAAAAAAAAHEARSASAPLFSVQQQQFQQQQQTYHRQGSNTPAMSDLLVPSETETLHQQQQQQRQRSSSANNSVSRRGTSPGAVLRAVHDTRFHVPASRIVPPKEASPPLAPQPRSRSPGGKAGKNRTLESSSTSPENSQQVKDTTASLLLAAAAAAHVLTDDTSLTSSIHPIELSQGLAADDGTIMNSYVPAAAVDVTPQHRRTLSGGGGGAAAENYHQSHLLLYGQSPLTLSALAAGALEMELDEAHRAVDRLLAMEPGAEHASIVGLSSPPTSFYSYMLHQQQVQNSNNKILMASTTTPAKMAADASAASAAAALSPPILLFPVGYTDDLTVDHLRVLSEQFGEAVERVAMFFAASAARVSALETATNARKKRDLLAMADILTQQEARISKLAKMYKMSSSYNLSSSGRLQLPPTGAGASSPTTDKSSDGVVIGGSSSSSSNLLAVSGAAGGSGSRGAKTAAAAAAAAGGSSSVARGAHLSENSNVDIPTLSPVTSRSTAADGVYHASPTPVHRSGEGN